MCFKLHGLIFFLAAALLSCTPRAQPPTQTSLYVYRFEPPAFVEFSTAFEPVDEIPFSIPPNCSLFDSFSPSRGGFLLVELSCPNGQTVLFLDTATGSIFQPVTDTDSHFLAWAGEGEAAYLKVDSLGDARVVRAFPKGKLKQVQITGWAYDLSSRPGSDDLIYSVSRGLGYGSELNAARANGQNTRLLVQDPFHYISFARYSPDGSRIAFIKIPDTQTPFTVGELWVIEADGSNPSRLAEADAGHGYAANWSPDGGRIAFVVRTNPQNESADQSTDSLLSNIYLVHVQSGELSPVTSFTNGRAETPRWSPDGNRLAFTTVLNGRMDVQIADITTGEIRPLTAESTCCPAWMHK
jgi:dipeptidyl aminopeptidase/acylaminoacyl peptidase